MDSKEMRPPADSRRMMRFVLSAFTGTWAVSSRKSFQMMSTVAGPSVSNVSPIRPVSASLRANSRAVAASGPEPLPFGHTSYPFVPAPSSYSRRVPAKAMSMQPALSKEGRLISAPPQRARYASVSHQFLAGPSKGPGSTLNTPSKETSGTFPMSGIATRRSWMMRPVESSEILESSLLPPSFQVSSSASATTSKPVSCGISPVRQSAYPSRRAYSSTGYLRPWDMASAWKSL